MGLILNPVKALGLSRNKEFSDESYYLLFLDLKILSYLKNLRRKNPTKLTPFPALW